MDSTFQRLRAVCAATARLLLYFCRIKFVVVVAAAVVFRILMTN